MDSKVQVQHFELIFLPLCTKWDIHVRLTHPDLWLKAVTRPEDNVHYYAYILCYVHDILCIHHDLMSVMNEINGYLPLKPSSVGNPDIYLGAKLKQT
jgi:hypothetical protein